MNATPEDIQRVREHECTYRGHDWQVIQARGIGPVRVLCGHCGVDSGLVRNDQHDEAVMHLIGELRGQLEQTEAERDRHKHKVAELTQKLAAGAMAVHSDPDPM